MLVILGCWTRDDLYSCYCNEFLTPASTLTWVTYMVSQHPEVEEKIVKELDEVLNGEVPNEQNVHNLKVRKFLWLTHTLVP